MTDSAPFTWTVVIPVKVLSRAKSRLAAFAGPRRADLALAFACDTVAAALAIPDITRVVVVTADELVGRSAAALGATVVTDVTDGLNEALLLGAAQATGAAQVGGPPASQRAAALPGLTSEERSDERGGKATPGRRPRGERGEQGIAGLAADLPALRPAELARALAQVRHGAAFVPDLQGTGTTLYAVPPSVPFQPQFGGMSRDRHLAHGCAELGLDDTPGLRRDVDTPEDLMAALALGVGEHTAPVATAVLRCAPLDRSASA